MGKVVNTPPVNQGFVRDDKAGSVGENQDITQCVSQKPVSLAKQGLQSESYAMRTQTGFNWQTGNCLHCQNDFKRKTTWQKYCHENCRIAAYELRTGKRVNLRKQVKVVELQR